MFRVLFRRGSVQIMEASKGHVAASINHMSGTLMNALDSEQTKVWSTSFVHQKLNHVYWLITRCLGKFGTHVNNL